MNLPDSHPTALTFASSRCGPECRFATPLPLKTGEWVWCARHGGPRSVGSTAALCRWFASRRESTAVDGGRRR